MTTPTDLERSLMDVLLRGEHPGLDVLLRQWAEADIVQRETSGVGCIVTIKLPATTRVLATNQRITLGDVVVDLPGREAVAGALLFIEGGALAMLELFTFDGPWPADTSGFRVRYTREPRVLSQLDGGGVP